MTQSVKHSAKCDTSNGQMCHQGMVMCSSCSSIVVVVIVVTGYGHDLRIRVTGICHICHEDVVTRC